MPPITARFEHTENDVVEAGLSFYKQNSRKFYILIPIGSVLIGVLSIFQLPDARHDISFWIMVVGTAIFPVLLLFPFMMFAMPMLVKNSAKTNFKNTPALKGAYEYVFANDAITWATPMGHGERAWSVFLKCWEAPTAFLMFVGPMVYELIPKRSFESAADLDVFRELAKAQISKFETVQ